MIKIYKILKVMGKVNAELDRNPAVPELQDT